MSTAPALRLSHISKSFGTLRANDDISLQLMPGEVLALLGENGAGKSTLMAILFGHYLADAGSIEAHGRPLPPGQPKAALAAGIGMVHQHFQLADNLSVLDNVMLGLQPLWQPFSRRAAVRERLLHEAGRFGLQVQPEAMVAELSVGERQRVEILKALVRGARILILDEPTAVLTPQESESLFATLAQMVAAGLSIIFISHKLDEVLRVSHRVLVLRAGRLVLELPTAQADKALLAEAMVGRSVAPAMRRAATRHDNTPLLQLEDASLPAQGAQCGLVQARLSLHRGEVLAVAGVSGNGQQALAELLCGQRAASAGRLLVQGRTLPARPRAFIEAGVARVPEDRHQLGVVGDLPLWENVLLERYASRPFAHAGLRHRRRARSFAADLLRRCDVRGAGGPELPARALSGGNMQKLILGRALAFAEQPPPLIIANQPTWGLDVGAVAAVHQQLLDACAAGSGVLLISEDLDEVFALADRITVIHAGRLSPVRPTAMWSLASIGLAMAGAEEHPAGDASAAATA